MSSVLKKIPTILYSLVVLVLVTFASLLTLSALNIPQGIRLYIVQSGSMAPAIPTGSLVITKPQGTYQVGDVITFKTEAERQLTRPQNTVTHRLIEIKEENNQKQFTTKGDANQVSDGTTISEDLVLGRTLFHIPWIGYVLTFAKTKEGLLFLIIIPATIIIYNEILAIKKELVTAIHKRRENAKKKDVAENE